MIPFKIHTISPYLRDKTRLFALTSGADFGYNVIHDEHLIERLNSFVGNLDNSKVYNQHSRIRNIAQPDFKRGRERTANTISDLILPDNFKQHSEMMERYRGGLPTMTDIRQISDGATRHHIACSRGYERHLVNFITRLDTEMLDRKSIRPLI